MQKAVQNSQSSFYVGSTKLTASHRLHREDRFDHVVREHNITDKYFKVFYALNRKENARLGIIASKRTLPRAVDRNRVKRMIREAFRRHHVKTRSVDIVVMVRMAFAQNAGLKTEELNALFGQIEDKCVKS